MLHIDHTPHEKYNHYYRNILEVEEDLSHHLIIPDLYHWSILGPLLIYNRDYHLIIKLIWYPILHHCLEPILIIILIQQLLELDKDLDPHRLNDLELETVTLHHIQNVHQEHQSSYHILIILILILMNKDRIIHLNHVPHDRLHIDAQDLLYPYQDLILDLNIVITILILLTSPQIKMNPVQQRKRHQKNKRRNIW